MGVSNNDSKSFISSKSASGRLDMLKQKSLYMYRKGVAFEVTKSGSAYSLESGIYNQSVSFRKMDSDDARFIKKVRKEIKDGGVSLSLIDNVNYSSDIKYIRVNDKYRNGTVLDDLLCLDINSAYWRTAYLMGVISEKTYLLGMDMGKVTRLASLGSLAKTKETWCFDGVDFFSKSVERSVETEHIWFAICRKVSDLMTQIADELGDEFIFYWVDGLYIKNSDENKKKVVDFFAKYDYLCSSDEIKQIKFNDSDFEVYVSNKDTPKVFSYRHKNKLSKRNEKMRDLKEMTKIKNTVNSVLNGKYDYLK